jgi:hypothetical protein
MTMEEYATLPAPGVRLELVLTEPARVLRTGVPVFLGLVNEADIKAWNEEHDDPDNPDDADERFLCKRLDGDTGPAIVRKRGYLSLPSRAVGRASEEQISDPFSHDVTTYLRAVPGRARSERYRAKIRSSLGAAGPPRATPATQTPDGDLLKAIGTKPQRFTIWLQFEQTYRGLASAGFLSYAVRGFFENGGNLCYVQLISYPPPGGPQDVSLALTTALEAGLGTLANYDDYDLVCVPDLMWESSIRENPKEAARLQDLVTAHCAQLGERMAILDSVPGGEKSTADVIAHRDLLHGEEGALYYPWVRVPGGPEATGGYVPPCGHVAGVYARTDVQVGVHKAPANEVLEGVVDLSGHLRSDDQGPLNDLGINCLRAFPQRGIRVWGARTLSRGKTWHYVNVRRVVLTAARWIASNLSEVAFEPHTELLWARISRDVTAYLTDLARRGALAGPQGEGVFYVKCDAETNPPETRELGIVVTEIGLKPAAPVEFIVIRIIHGPAGVEIIDPHPRTA